MFYNIRINARFNGVYTLLYFFTILALQLKNYIIFVEIINNLTIKKYEKSKN